MLHQCPLRLGKSSSIIQQCAFLKFQEKVSLTNSNVSQVSPDAGYYALRPYELEAHEIPPVGLSNYPVKTMNEDEKREALEMLRYLYARAQKSDDAVW